MKSSFKQLKIKGEKQLKEFKNIDKSKTLKAIGEISKKKMMKQINDCLNLRIEMRHLIMQNSFVQKLMELNTTLIFLRFH